MQKIIRVLKSIFVPYLPSRAESDFMSENGKHWKPSNGKPGILVETALSNPASLIEKFLIAKLIEQQTGTSTVALLNSLTKSNSQAYGVAKSFGVRRFICWWRGYFNLRLLGASVAKTFSVIRGCATGAALLDLKINDVHIGDLVYDSLIRYRPNCYTVGPLNIRQHFRLIFRAIYNFHNTTRVFAQYDIKAVVTSHTVYAEFGILCRIAHASGAAVYLKDMDVFRVYDQTSNIYEHFLKVSNSEFALGLDTPEVVQLAEKYFEDRLGGRIDQIDLKNAYTGKRMYEKEDFLSKMGAAPDKKNVFVLAHAFSDAPHVGGKLAFDDYYVWLRETLLALSKNTAVNVFVKPHPSSYMWGERGAVEMLLDEIGVHNVHVTPKDLNTLSISSIADYVVTARGTAGLEYSGFGIPAITCGEGYYSGFGIAIERNARDAYLDQLAAISDLAPLAPQVTLKARVLLYLTFTKLARSSIAPARHIYPGDDTERLVPEHFDEMKTRLQTKGSYQDSFHATVSEAVLNAL